MNRDAFDACVEEVLVHELRPRDVVILDDLSRHKSERPQRLIESQGATLEFLPPYGPDIKPIETVFSKVKQVLRSLACRTTQTLRYAMESVFDPVTLTDAANCFRHCGYSLRED